MYTKFINIYSSLTCLLIRNTLGWLHLQKIKTFKWKPTSKRFQEVCRDVRKMADSFWGDNVWISRNQVIQHQRQAVYCLINFKESKARSASGGQKFKYYNNQSSNSIHGIYLQRMCPTAASLDVDKNSKVTGAHNPAMLNAPGIVGALTLNYNILP